MYRLICCCVIALALSLQSLAQSFTFVGAEISYSTDHYQVADAGGKIVQAELNSALLGVIIRRMISSHIYLESGIYTREYQEGLAFKGNLSMGGTGRRVGQLPMRIGASVPAIKKRFLIRPVTGLILNIAGERQYSSSWGDIDYGNSGILHYEYDYKYQTQVFFLVQAGLSIDIRLGKKCFLGISANHFSGLQKIHIQEIRYGMNNDPMISAATYSKGNYCSIGTVFSYRLGK